MPERNHAQTDADLFNSPAVSTHDVSVLSQDSCHKLSPTPAVRLLQIKQRIVLMRFINPLNAELNPICCLLALLGVHHFLHVSRIRVKSLTLRLLMYY